LCLYDLRFSGRYLRNRAPQGDFRDLPVTVVGPDGVIWGTGKYEQLDPGSAEAFAVFLESLITGKHPFMAVPQIMAIPDTVSIGVAGDWGTGEWRTAANPAPSVDVGNHMAFQMKSR